jgi:hypothetical protein
MLYFESLPKIITPDQNGYPILMTNLLARASLIEKLINNPMIFYEYAIQEGDTPEIVAEKYYDDPFKYWVVMFSNQIFDPIWDWPMSYTVFLDYLNSKYATEAEDAGQTPYEYTNTTVYEYEKIITTRDLFSEVETVKNVPVTLTEYNALSESTTTYDIPGGTRCVVTITKKIVTIYNYEEELNESKRQIKLLNKDFAGEIENQLFQLMRVE